MKILLLFVFLALCAANLSSVSKQKSHAINAKQISSLNKIVLIKGGEIQSKLPLPVLKLALQFLLTSLNSLCWLLPLHFKSISQDKQLLSRGNVFAGG